jgi:hypothetical protein
VIGPSQRPLPEKAQHLQETNIHAPGGIRNRDPSKRTVAEPRLRPRGHRQRLGTHVLDLIVPGHFIGSVPTSDRNRYGYSLRTQLSATRVRRGSGIPRTQRRFSYQEHWNVSLALYQQQRKVIQNNTEWSVTIDWRLKILGRFDLLRHITEERFALLCVITAEAMRVATSVITTQIQDTFSLFFFSCYFFTFLAILFKRPSWYSSHSTRHPLNNKKLAGPRNLFLRSGENQIPTPTLLTPFTCSLRYSFSHGIGQSSTGKYFLRWLKYLILYRNKSALFFTRE